MQLRKEGIKNSGSKGSNPDLCDPPDTGAVLFGFLYAVATFTARIFLTPMADGSLDKTPKSFVLNCFFFAQLGSQLPLSTG